MKTSTPLFLIFSIWPGLLHNVLRQDVNKYLLARLPHWQARQAETAQPERLCCVDYWPQRIRLHDLITPLK